GRLAAAREMLLEQRLPAAEDLAAVELARGRPARVVELLSDELVRVPGRERAATLLVDALVATGHRGSAGEVSRRTRAYLANELGLDPGPELTRAHQAALAGAPSEQPVLDSWYPSADGH